MAWPFRALVVLAAMGTIGSGHARAEPVEPPPTSPPGTAADVVDAPRPDRATGVSRPESKSLGTRLLWIPRVLLFVPRWASEVVLWPTRQGLELFEKEQVQARLTRVFFNEQETIGVYPVAFFEAGFGLNVGARGVFRDLLGGGEGARLRASYGGRYEQLYTARLHTGERLGPLKLKLLGEYTIRDREPFFGIGNADLAEADPMAAPIDPLTSDIALSSRFSQRVASVRGGLGTRDDGPLSATLSSGLLARKLGAAEVLRDGRQLTDNYRTDSLVGWDTGITNVYTELELEYDTRRSHSHYESKAAWARGWHLIGFAGYARGIDDDPSRYFRWGFDLQRFINLYRGSRVLALRLLAEGVTSPLDEVPFTDLPRLGGPKVLRGYSTHRFRDRVVAMASAEYMYEVSAYYLAYLFVDTGRAWRQVRDVGYDDLRLGYGAGIQVHGATSFVMRMALASSIDGGLFFNLNFDPVYNPGSRQDRK